MEMMNQPRVRAAYYFSWPDQEILDERILSLSCDEDTWLYKMDNANFNGESQMFLHYDSTSPNKHLLASGGSVDSRTFTRRKHGSLRPALNLVAESPLSNNRSSLGLLSSSMMLNNSLAEKSMLKAKSQEKTFSNSTASDTSLPHRTFKLDTPFMNSSAFDRNIQNPLKKAAYERLRFDSESSESSILPSLENFSPFEKNDALTDSLVTFLEKDVACCPPTEFQDDGGMSDSLVSLTAEQNPHSIVDINGKNGSMTDSLINFLGPVNCKPPSGFEDNDMSVSVVSIKESDVLPSSDMTSSVLDYLENVKASGSLIESTTSSETENIPPNSCDSNDNLTSNSSDRPKPAFDRTVQISRHNLTYELVDNEDLKHTSGENEYNETTNITYTNSVNSSRRRRANGGFLEDSNITKPGNNTFKRETISKKDNSDRIYKTDLNIRDSNIIQGHNNEVRKMSSNELLTEDYHYKSNASNKQMNSTFSKSDFETLNTSRQIPLRNSTFNTTFTKLNPPSKNATFAKSTEGLNGGLEDDQTSSASDSSFSSSSTKPRSFDELQVIAHQQEISLVYQSTPTETHLVAAKLNIELSPIRGLSSPSRSNESRSANCSPVRSSSQRPLYPHPISKLQQPSLDSKRQMFTSSLSNIARPQVSGLRMPQPITRTGIPQKTETRAITAPAPGFRSIPRPQAASRLPMPRYRGSGIPGPRKRGGVH